MRNRTVSHEETRHRAATGLQARGRCRTMRRTERRMASIGSRVSQPGFPRDPVTSSRDFLFVSCAFNAFDFRERDGCRFPNGGSRCLTSRSTSDLWMTRKQRPSSAVRETRSATAMGRRKRPMGTCSMVSPCLAKLPGVRRAGPPTWRRAASRGKEACRSHRAPPTLVDRAEPGKPGSARRRALQKSRTGEELVESARRRLSNLDALAEQGIVWQVRPTVSGRVTEIKTQVGATLSPGEHALSIETGEEGLDVLICGRCAGAWAWSCRTASDRAPAQPSSARSRGLLWERSDTAPAREIIDGRPHLRVVPPLPVGVDGKARHPGPPAFGYHADSGSTRTVLAAQGQEPNRHVKRRRGVVHSVVAPSGRRL